MLRTRCAGHWRSLWYLVTVSCALQSSALPRVKLQPQRDGSMALVTVVDGYETRCAAVLTPHGMSLAVKGAPWIPINDHFERETSLSQYDLELLASAGVNVIRLGAMMPGVLPNPPVNGVYTSDERYIAKLKALVSDAAQFGIYTLIEFHQDVLSELYCGEGIPHWAAIEVHEAFPHEFEEEVLHLFHTILPSIPGLVTIEDDRLRAFVRSSMANRVFDFPAPIADPYVRVSNSTDRFYDKADCDSLLWFKYHLSFAAGHAYRRLFDLSSSTFRHFLNYWKILAESFKDDPNVLAFDIFNEPFPGNFFTEPWIIEPVTTGGRLLLFYKEISSAIHGIDNDRLVTFSPVTWEEGGTYMQMLNAPAVRMCDWMRKAMLGIPWPGCETFWDVVNWLPEKGLETTGFEEAPLLGKSILSFHFYTPPELNHEVYALKRKRDAQKLGVYPLLSETCCLWDDDASQRLWWFENFQIGWIVWEYKNQANDNGFGAFITGTGPPMFHRDSTPLKTQWRRLAHPSAQFVYGEIVANIFDFTTGIFNLTFIPYPSDCVNASAGTDAIIVWPWTWWSYINITSQPGILVNPPTAAEVFEAPQGSATPVVRFAVSVLQRDVTITVTLRFQNFVNMDLVKEEPEPTIHGPWWAGLGWALLAALPVGCAFGLNLCCCYFCCRYHRSKKPSLAPAREARREYNDRVGEEEVPLLTLLARENSTHSAERRPLMLSRNTSSVTESDVHALGGDTARAGGTEARTRVGVDVILEVPSARTEPSGTGDPEGTQAVSLGTTNPRVEGGLMQDDSPSASRRAAYDGDGDASLGVATSVANGAAAALLTIGSQLGEQRAASPTPPALDRSGVPLANVEQVALKGSQTVPPGLITEQAAPAAARQDGSERETYPFSYSTAASPDEMEILDDVSTQQRDDGEVLSSSLCAAAPVSARSLNATARISGESRNSALQPVANTPAEVTSSRELVFPPL